METLEAIKRKHIKQNRAIIKSNTLYAIQLRKAEVEISRLSIENIELRTTISQLTDQVEKLQCDHDQRNSTSDLCQPSFKAKNDQIADIIQQLRSATDSLNALVEADAQKLVEIDDENILDHNFAERSSGNSGVYKCITPAELDIWAEKIPDKKKPLNLLTIYRKQTKPLSAIKDEPEEPFIEKENMLNSGYPVQYAINPQTLPDESLSVRPDTLNPKNYSLSSKHETIPSTITQYEDNLSQVQPNSFQLEHFVDHLDGINKSLLAEINLSSVCEFPSSQQFQDPSHRRQSLPQIESSQIGYISQEHNPFFSSQSDLKSKHVYTPQPQLKNTKFQNSSIRSTSNMSAKSTGKPIDLVKDISPAGKKIIQQRIGCVEDQPSIIITSSSNKIEVVGEEQTRTRRKPQINYTEPSLRSKLRKGDPFTNSFGIAEFDFTKSEQPKRKKSTTTIKKRTALSNITNMTG
ncbi:hypothetical protein G9A89_012257 [Geosiphon pyriformis]|nr:hypothetical protein G9A89_012257 [Geosiphon pyriformis]